MSTTATPIKRRKMRPNNAILLERAKVDAERPKAVEVVKEKTKEKDPENINEKSKKKEKRPAPAKESTFSIPTPKKYVSASDSDETDDEIRARYAKQQKRSSISSAVKSHFDIPMAKQKSKPTAKKDHSSDSESDGKSKSIIHIKKNHTKRKTSEPEVSNVVSASDSDDTDKESTSQNKVQKPTKSKVMSDSDSDDTDKETTRKKKPAKRTKSDKTTTKKKTMKPTQPGNTSDSDSDETDKENTKSKFKKESKISMDRISYRRKRAYDEDLSVAENFKLKSSDLFVPKVNKNYFISDSDSETDSGEDYDNKEYPPWQVSLAENNKKDDPWPKQRRMGYSDKAKLEKRIKKICRREGLSFAQAQAIFSNKGRREYIKFFQKIVKPFPNLSLHGLSFICKTMYHEKRNLAPWTPEEEKELQELIKIHGTSPTKLSHHLNRSPRNIREYMYAHQDKPANPSKKWTQEQSELLAREATKVIQKEGKLSFHTIVPLFKDCFTQNQVHRHHQSICHRIKPDGTLEPARKATPYEELRYLKKLMVQVRKDRLIEESQLELKKDRGFVSTTFYYKNRAKIDGFEKMTVKDILKKLIEKQRKIIASRIEEKLLEPEPESD